MDTYSRLTLVGAGPGDPELITLKGVKALESADVVLYDALANPDLLIHAPETALRIYVGKRAGMHEKQQDEINRMIVGYAKTMGHVVRLKGGDAFVFGRGHEELEYAASHGVPGEYVPGISSAFAVPGLAGFPLTKRGCNESVTIVTGTLKNGSLSDEIQTAARGNSTVVILMGTRKLNAITEIFKKERGSEEPIALIQNGSRADEKTLVGTVSDIKEKLKADPIYAPAIIIIGMVVRERQLLAKVMSSADDLQRSF
ncbi:uroporphyrinogen-III C-methyltransferase [Lunatibacter salilacus]|uniref:uroporphyrinogen-III C-methyltransferase n=1 Tax=Lunatibacter salilacus TaxID=2483804 RepID=UPI00131C7C1B|nr:uroporphyrinogen-III C-methyltransferase [Lunatibacter salilacus]